MRNQGSSVAKLSEVRTQHLNDFNILEAFISKLQGMEQKMHTKLDGAKRNLAKLSEELIELSGEAGRLRTMQAKQELTPDDVVRMKTARRKLDEKASSLHAQKDTVHQRVWKCEVQLSKIREETEKVPPPLPPSLLPHCHDWERVVDTCGFRTLTSVVCPPHRVGCS
jgi:SMC interacting uncharacterized protein involved in chromosome segregation